jgi:alpha-glucosidase
MNFNKIPPAINFRYVAGSHKLLSAGNEPFIPSLADCGEDVYKYCVGSDKWAQKSQVRLNEDAFSSPSLNSSMTLAEDGTLRITLHGKALLRSFEGREFGVLGKKWNLSLAYDESMRFYGLGEKNTGMEKSGHICNFWNTDAFLDFGLTRSEVEATDPLYASVPYVLIEQETGCVGILLNNPYPSFMNLGAKENIANLLDASEAEPQCISIGAYDGTPELYFILGTSVKEVTRKLQRLTGITALPPLWSLGYHQCRFGYRDLADLEELDQKFDALGIPCDGLWLDIHYMDGFKVFTVDEKGFKDHSSRIERLQEKGRKIVPIIDPGVKNHPDFGVFNSGQAVDAFCKTPEGNLYSGFVWPGRTAFPDFSQARVREWWAGQVKSFTEEFAFDGYWIDMNDPSTGSSELEDMLFNDGQDSHESYHNQYALGMQEATLAGLESAIGNKRPFIISRSGFIGSQQFSAIWTGDNWSNYFHLREGIAMTLNLSLSGIPFNGPDVPGFAGEASPELAVDWHKAGFLFPFFRNHSANISPKQEPWQFEAPYCNTMIHFIRLRYKLLPYLYNLFIEHLETGDPYLRPLFYEFEDDRENLDRIGDQFLVGASIMQAPIVEEGTQSREIYLPGVNWFDTATGQWLNGGTRQTLDTQLRSTGLYMKEGAMIPMQVGTPTTPEKDLSEIELHIFTKTDTSGCHRYTYCFDDGETVDAPLSRVEFEAEVIAGELHIRVLSSHLTDRSLHVKFVTYAGFSDIYLEQCDSETKLLRQESTFELNGARLTIENSQTIEIEDSTLEFDRQLQLINAD